jgi:hypothetical protein
VWADDPILQKKATPPPTTPMSNASVARPAQSHRADLVRTPPPASKTNQPKIPSTPLTPAQKRFLLIEAALSDSPQTGKEKRLADIQAGLAQSPTTSTSQLQPLVFPTDPPVQSHSQSQPRSPPSSQPYGTPFQKAKPPKIPSPSPSYDSGDDVFSTPVASQGSTIKEAVQYQLPTVIPSEESEARTAKRVKLSHPSSSEGGDSSSTRKRNDTERGMGLFTPPRTVKHSHVTTPANVELPRTPTSKGKGRDMSHVGEPLSQWQNIVPDEVRSELLGGE